MLLVKVLNGVGLNIATGTLCTLSDIGRLNHIPKGDSPLTSLCHDSFHYLSDTHTDGSSSHPFDSFHSLTQHPHKIACMSIRTLSYEHEPIF